jgi:hypothetical protein
MIEVLKQAAEDVSKAYDVLAFSHTERALELLAKTRTSLRQAIAELESQEPVGYVAENGVVDWNVCAPPILTDLYTHPLAQPAPVQEPEYVYTCNGCDTLYREDDVACDCTVNGLMEFTRHILAPDTTPPAQPPQRTWVGLDYHDKKKFSSWLDHKSDDEVFTAIEAKLKEKNT